MCGYWEPDLLASDYGKKKDTSAIERRKSGCKNIQQKNKDFVLKAQEEKESKIKSVWALSFTFQCIGVDGRS